MIYNSSEVSVKFCPCAIHLWEKEEDKRRKRRRKEGEEREKEEGIKTKEKKHRIWKEEHFII